MNTSNTTQTLDNADAAASSLPVTPLADLEQWSAKLQQIASQPLECCPHFPRIAARFEAWWNQELLDRPILIGAANPKPQRPITRRLDLLEDYDAWFEAKIEDLHQLHCVGDWIPHVRVDLGPAMMGGLIGANMEFGADTGWTHACINDDWSNTPDWEIADDNRWWTILCDLTKRVAEDAAGRYLVCTPDFTGNADVVTNLRGATELCLDVLDKPQIIADSIDALYPAWHRVCDRLYDITTKRDAGMFHWLRLWSNRPYVICAADLGFSIGPKDFRRICLPDIARQCATVGRGIFHLDGSGSTRQLDALLEIPQMRAIQYTPGEGSQSVLPWIEMFTRIQDAGRSLLIITPPQEVFQLCDALRPEGLAILLDHVPPAAELDELFAQLCKRFGVAAD